MRARRARRAVLAALALLGAAEGLTATRHGVLWTPDALAFAGAGENLAEGRGLTVPFVGIFDRTPPAAAAAHAGAAPLQHYAPGWPALLGAAGTLGAPVEDAGRVLSSLLLGVNGLLAGALAGRVARSTAAAAAGGLLFLADYETVWLHGSLLTEPAFVAATLGALLGLLALLAPPPAPVGQREVPGAGARRGRAGAFAAFVALGAAAALVRYAGLAVLLAGAIALARSRDPWLRRRAWVPIAGALPALAWMARGSDHERVRARVLPAAQWRSAFDTVSGWLLPFEWPRPLLAAALTAAAITVGFAAARARRAGEHAPLAAAATLGLFVTAFVAVTVLAAATVAGAADIGHRLLAPAQPVVWAAVLGVLAAGVRAAGGRRPAAVLAAGVRAAGVRRAAAALAVGVALVVGFHAASSGRGSLYPDGTVGWLRAGAVSHPLHPGAEYDVLGPALRALPAATTVVSDAPEVAWLAGDRSAIGLPWRADPGTHEPVDPGPALAELAALARQRPVAVLFVRPYAFSHPHLVDRDTLERALALDCRPAGTAGELCEVAA